MSPLCERMSVFREHWAVCLPKWEYSPLIRNKIHSLKNHLSLGTSTKCVKIICKIIYCQHQRNEDEICIRLFRSFELMDFERSPPVACYPLLWHRRSLQPLPWNIFQKLCGSCARAKWNWSLDVFRFIFFFFETPPFFRSFCLPIGTTTSFFVSCRQCHRLKKVESTAWSIRANKMQLTRTLSRGVVRASQRRRESLHGILYCFAWKINLD